MISSVGYLFLVSIFPFSWPVAAFVLWRREISVTEAATNLLLGVLIAVSVFYAGRYSQMADTELLNGELVSKSREWVSCSHSYSCHCKQVCTGSGKDRSCSESCDTCYEHSNDWDYVLHSSVGNIEVDRIDRQGTLTPPRFASAKIGEPVAVTHGYVNYVKGAPDSLFHWSQSQSQAQSLAVPAYPINIYDLHRVDRAVSAGVSVPDLAEWNNGISEKLKKLGAARQANLVVVFANTQDRNWMYSLQRAWIGGKKNDVIVIVGAPEYPKVEWVEVLAWTDREMFKVALRDAIQAAGEVSPSQTLSIIEQHMLDLYQRKPMEDYAYLSDEIEPPLWVIVLAGLLGAASSIGCSLWFRRTNF